MKHLMAVLENPRRGGQIVLPRRLLELMFDSTPVKNDAQACVMILLRCCYDDEGGEGGLKMGEMYATVSGLSEELHWSKKADAAPAGATEAGAAAEDELPQPRIVAVYVDEL